MVIFKISKINFATSVLFLFLELIVHMKTSSAYTRGKLLPKSKIDNF